jgi:hypothetical protein
LDGPAKPGGKVNPRIGEEDAGVIGGAKRELPINMSPWDAVRPAGRGGG